MVVIPNDVIEYCNQYETKTARHTELNKYDYSRGYRDGKEFNKRDRIESNKDSTELSLRI